MILKTLEFLDWFIAIGGFFAIAIFFLAFTWNPQHNEDSEELNIGEPIDETVKIDKVWGKEPINVAEYSTSSNFDGTDSVDDVLQDIHIHKSDNHEVIEKELPPIINDSPTFPYPSAKELKITKGSKLESVYNHLLKHHRLLPSDYSDLKILKGNAYIWKLRKKGILIETVLDENKNFIKYVLK